MSNASTTCTKPQIDSMARDIIFKVSMDEVQEREVKELGQENHTGPVWKMKYSKSGRTFW